MAASRTSRWFRAPAVKTSRPKSVRRRLRAWEALEARIVLAAPVATNDSGFIASEDAPFTLTPSTITYDAGADMLANELGDPATEVQNPNPATPWWSYGQRAATVDPSLTLYTAANHVNDQPFGTQFEGFTDLNTQCCGRLPSILVNTGPAIGGPDGTINTGELFIHPDGDGGTNSATEEKAVVRFTAPVASNYNISSFWEDTDDCCNDATFPGVDVHVVVHNAGGSFEVFGAQISREPAPGLPQSTAYAGNIFLQAGDRVDFVVGSRTQLYGDATRFNAVITRSTSILANDQDLDNDTLTVSGFSPTSANGATVTVTPTGGFTYDPTNAAAIQQLSAGETLTDTFTYTASDGNGGTSTGTVTLTVNGANDRLVATNDSFTVSGSSPTTTVGNVLANDTGIDDDEVVTVGRVNGSPANVNTPINFGPGGSITVSSNGDVQFQPTAQSQGLQQGQTVVNTLTYQASSNQLTVGAPSTATSTSPTGFTVSATDLLSGSAATASSGSFGQEGTNTDSAILTNGQFGNPGNPLDNTQTVAIGNDSSLTYSLDTAASPFGYDISGVDVYSGWRDAGRDNQNYTVLVETVGNPGVFTPIGGANFGVDNGSGRSSITPTGGTLLATGVSRVRFDFGPQENGYVGYRELDVFGTPTPGATLTVTVTGQNDAPTVTVASPAIAPVNEGQAISNSGTFNDPDVGDIVTITATANGNPIGTITQSPGNSGNYTWNFVASDDTAGPVTVTITATDALGATATTQFTYQANNVAPTLTISGPATIGEGSPYTLTLASSDPGADTISSWTINWGDGTAPETVPGNTPSVTHVYGDGPAAVQITATARDEDNVVGPAYTSNTVNVAVTNVAPDPYQVSVTVDGVTETPAPDTITVTPGMTVSFTVATDDPSTDTVDGPFLFEIDFGDESPFETDTATLEDEQVTFTHVYSTTSDEFGFQPRIRVTDADGTVSAWEDLTLVVSSTLVVIGDTLYIGGTELADRIIVSTGRGGIIVRMNNKLYPGQDASQVVAFGGVGADTITFNSIIPVPVTFHGQEGNDYLAGGGLEDTLDGGAGRDRLYGNGGNDILLGGDGNDTIYGGKGDDYLSGDEEVDIVGGTDLGDGNVTQPGDVIESEDPGNDRMSGDAGNDTAIGGGGSDVIDGGLGSDILRGGEGSDRISGAGGNDLLTGDAGGDRLAGGAGRDVIIGGTGFDLNFGGSSADLIFAGTFEEGSLDLAELIEDWGAVSSMDEAIQDLSDAAIDDETPDSLNGEADDDWFLTFMRDFFQISAEGRGSNETVELD